MNKTIKKCMGAVGAMAIAAASFRAGMAYGGGTALGMVSESLIHIPEQKAIEMAKDNRKHSYPTWKDIVFEMGLKKGYK